jgi:hypothetical protein
MAKVSIDDLDEPIPQSRPSGGKSLIHSGTLSSLILKDWVEGDDLQLINTKTTHTNPSKTPQVFFILKLLTKIQSRLFQNFSFWNSFLRFDGKTGFLTGFSGSLFHRTRGSHRARLAHSQLVLEQAQSTRF